MACKRGASSELNHDNWNCEDEPEEAGTFATAPEEVLKSRVVRTAKRRLQSGEGGAKSAFEGFSGFKPPSTSAASPFSFLTKENSTGSSSKLQSQATSFFRTVIPPSNGSTKTSENGLSFPVMSSTTSKNPESVAEKKKMEEPEKKDDKIIKQPSEYYAKLKGLNESVTTWIERHVGVNPFCILTPIFRDYEKHLKDIEAKHGKYGIQSSSSKESGEELKKIESEASKTSLVTASSSEIEDEKKANLTFQPTTSAASWKPEKSIFANTNLGANVLFGSSGDKSIFGNKSAESSSFAIESKDKSSNEGNDSPQKLETKTLTFPTTNAGTFSFGQSSSSGTTSASFSFGGKKPFSFGTGAVVPQSSENKESEDKDEDEEPPKPEFKPVTEEGAIFEKRCKLFVKKDGVFGDRGVGMLFLKPTPNGKTQLILRAENSLGNLLLNTLLTDSIPTKRMNKNTVMLVCLPLPDSSPPPTPVLLRVKGSEDADSLFEALENNKK